MVTSWEACLQQVEQQRHGREQHRQNAVLEVKPPDPRHIATHRDTMICISCIRIKPSFVRTCHDVGYAIFVRHWLSWLMAVYWCLPSTASEQTKMQSAEQPSLVQMRVTDIESDAPNSVWRECMYAHMMAYGCIWHTLGEIYESYPKVSPQIDPLINLIISYLLFPCIQFPQLPEMCTLLGLIWRAWMSKIRKPQHGQKRWRVRGST